MKNGGFTMGSPNADRIKLGNSVGELSETGMKSVLVLHMNSVENCHFFHSWLLSVA